MSDAEVVHYYYCKQTKKLMQKKKNYCDWFYCHFVAVGVFKGLSNLVSISQTKTVVRKPLSI